MADHLLRPAGQFLRDDTIRGGMDLLFFVNSRHPKRADQMLAALSLGRAHYRVLYFVKRRPGMIIKDLLAILDITKQSFNRVAVELIQRGLLEQRQSDHDRRHRLLALTHAGEALEASIFNELRDNVAQAYSAAGEEAVAGFWTVMQHLIGEDGRHQFRRLQEN